MGGRTFLDTNVLLYLYDVGEPAKSAVARAFYDGMPPADIVVSTQVLQEFYWNATRKLEPPVEEHVAADHVRSFAAHEVVATDVPLILSGMARSVSAKIAFWDGLIVEAALRGDCARLVTEDLQDGREFDGLRVVNPFRKP